jgi:hypothetical protein
MALHQSLYVACHQQSLREYTCLKAAESFRMWDSSRACSVGNLKPEMRATDGPCQRAKYKILIRSCLGTNVQQTKKVLYSRQRGPLEIYSFLLRNGRVQLLGTIAKFTMLFLNVMLAMLKEQPLHVSCLNSRMCSGKNHWSICRLRAQAIRQQLQNYSSRMTSDLSNYGSLSLSSSSIF